MRFVPVASGEPAKEHPLSVRAGSAKTCLGFEHRRFAPTRLKRGRLPWLEASVSFDALRTMAGIERANSLRWTDLACFGSEWLAVRDDFRNWLLTAA